MSRRVLVIDDEYGVRSGIQQILEMEGYTVSVASTGREALGLIAEGAFDVALIDYQLPDLDGLTLLQAIRARQLDTMTCMITAYANIDMAIAATRQGIDFFLPKPFSPGDLLGVIETLLRHKTLREEAATLRKQNEASLLALASEKSQTHSLVSSLRDAVLVVNREGLVVLANRAMASLLGKDDSELARREVGEVLAGDAFAPLREAIASPGPGRRVFELALGERSYMASLSAFLGDDGEAFGRILTFADITDVQRMAMEKARFVRTMVHEFRSPLGAIRGQLEVAQERTFGEDLAPYLPFLERATRRIDGLVELIGDLLSLSKIDAERGRSTSHEPAVLPDVVGEVMDLYRERMAARGIKGETTLQGALPAVPMGAEDLKTVLVNLVGNAVKYNRDGGSVRVNAALRDAWLRLDVTDSGLGIKAESLPRVFEDFFREKRRETRDIEGNGLGLSITKRLVDRAGGHLEVRSEEGKGTTFSAFLPV
jgi:two-component system phosphate regulon sensor histidine kinase PhoR